MRTLVKQKPTALNLLLGVGGSSFSSMVSLGPRDQSGLDYVHLGRQLGVEVDHTMGQAGPSRAKQVAADWTTHRTAGTLAVWLCRRTARKYWGWSASAGAFENEEGEMARVPVEAEEGRRTKAVLLPQDTHSPGSQSIFQAVVW